MEHWTVHGKSFDGNDVPWIKDKKGKHYPVTDMDLKNPTPMFQHMISTMQAIIRFLIKISGKKNLNMGKMMPNKQYLFAPDCIEKDGRYYLYFCMADNSEGVAVFDKPDGSFEKPIQMPCGGINPAIFIEDKGKAYYYWGQFRACGVELNEDMVSFEEEKVVHNIVTEEEHGFHEGSSMRKRNGIYYYIYPCVYRDKTPQKILVDCIGDGEITVLANGKKITEVTAGTYEIKILCKGETVVHSVTIQ